MDGGNAWLWFLLCKFLAYYLLILLQWSNALIKAGDRTQVPTRLQDTCSEIMAFRPLLRVSKKELNRPNAGTLPIVEFEAHPALEPETRDSSNKTALLSITSPLCIRRKFGRAVHVCKVEHFRLLRRDKSFFGDRLHRTSNRVSYVWRDSIPNHF